MLTVWTDHCNTQEEKDKFKHQVQGSKPVLEKLLTLVEREVKGLDAFELSSKSYDSANWAYKQAHTNGFRSCANTIKTILNLDQG